MLKAVIFDMDGVIIDSEPAHYEVNKIIFRSLNLVITDAEYGEFIGVSNTVMWKTLKERYGLLQTVEELVENQTKKNLEYLRNSDERPIQGVVKLLNELRNRGICMGIASSSPLEGIDLVMEKFNIREYFTSIMSGENLKRGKPHPDIFLNTANALGIAPEDCIVIEDSNHGVTAAKSAGMKCVGFKNANSGNQDLNRADLVVYSLENLDWNVLNQLFYYNK